MVVFEGVDMFAVEKAAEKVEVVQDVAEDVEDDADSTIDCLKNFAPPKKDWERLLQAARTGQQLRRRRAFYCQSFEVDNQSVAELFLLLRVILLSFCLGLPLDG